MRCDLTDTQTDRPKYCNPRCACALRVNYFKHKTIVSRIIELCGKSTMHYQHKWTICTCSYIHFLHGSRHVWLLCTISLSMEDTQPITVSIWRSDFTSFAQAGRWQIGQLACFSDMDHSIHLLKWNKTPINSSQSLLFYNTKSCHTVLCHAMSMV